MSSMNKSSGPVVGWVNCQAGGEWTARFPAVEGGLSDISAGSIMDYEGAHLPQGGLFGTTARERWIAGYLN
jgi:hypothetical protein